MINDPQEPDTAVLMIFPAILIVALSVPVLMIAVETFRWVFP